MHKTIPVGTFRAIIDSEDYELVFKNKWYPMKTHRKIYARATINGQITMMHWLIMNTKGIDHVNGNGLDNRRDNLRVASNSQNNANKLKTLNPTTSKYKGVSKGRWHSNWRATIKVNGKQKHLGYFPNEMQAAKAYDRAAKELFGEFAKTNF